MNPSELKLVVQEKYGEIAGQSAVQNSSSCCGSTGCCGDTDYTIFSDDYTMLPGYNSDADLGLGCGLPTEHAGIKRGDHVLDLGSGAGNDCFVARHLTGKEGKVTGLDFTQKMVDKARQNLEKTGFDNVEFIMGDIEDMPLPPAAYDVVISNCVLNLVPDKAKAFAQIHRVLKPGGHFCISDVVIEGELPDGIKRAAEMYAGCVSGAVSKDAYLELIRNQGFSDIRLNKEKAISIPDDILSNYLTEEELKAFRLSNTGIKSITITASK